MAIPNPETTKWLGLLVAGLLTTTFGTTFPNRFNQQRSPRAHNGVRLFNECLARSQLALFNYFLAVAITVQLATHERAKFLLVPVIVLATYTYVANVAASVELDKRLKDTHRCKATPVRTVAGEVTTMTATACNESIGFLEFIRLSARYIFWAGLLGYAAWRYAFLAGS